jgi:flagellar hook-associated protein 2
VGASDTLASIADKINEADGDFSAALVNHGGAVNPFNLTINAELSGLRGELLVDSIGVDLGLSTLSRAQDAVITIGGEGVSNPLLVTSSTNTVEDVIPGVTLNLLSASDERVTISVVQDVDSIVGAIETFVQAYNGTMDVIERDTSFDPENFARGPLFADPTVSVVRDRLHRTMVNRFAGLDRAWSFAFSVGLRVGEGNRLRFDEEEFREAYESSPEQVEAFFTTEDTGFAAVMSDTLDELTRDFDGVIARKDELLTDQQELLNDRIDSLNVLLEAKRARLEAEFVALESALAALQSQQTALSALAQLGQ